MVETSLVRETAHYGGDSFSQSERYYTMVETSLVSQEDSTLWWRRL